MGSLYFERPQGTKDYLPGDYERKKNLEMSINRVFSEWGYDLLETPLLEYEETIRQGIHKGEEEQLYRMFDNSGRTLTLRPEMTTPVARVATTLLSDQPLPLHLAYLEKTYRRVAAWGNDSSEVTQAGVELLGDASPDADAEVLAIMASALHAVGARHFRLAVGHMGYVGALLSDLPTEAQHLLRQALLRKDAVSYEQTLQNYQQQLPPEIHKALVALPRLRGGKEAIVKAREYAVQPQAQKACDDLEQLTEVLEAHGLASAVQFDIAQYLEHDYYTGILFEGYVESMGLPVCFGGRYDHLLEQFGRPVPATGGVLHLERLLSIVDDPLPAKKRFLLLTEKQDRSLAYAFAQYLRKQGVAVRVNRQEQVAPVDNQLSGWFRDGQLHSRNDRLLEYFRWYLQNEVR